MKRTFGRFMSLLLVLAMVLAMVPAALAANQAYSVEPDSTIKIKTSITGFTVTNRNRKLFSDASNDFSSFPLVFRYSRDLFGTPFSACSARICSNPCGQKRFPLKRTGSVSAFIS